MTSDEEMPENEEHTPETDWLIDWDDNVVTERGRSNQIQLIKLQLHCE